MAMSAIAVRDRATIAMSTVRPGLADCPRADVLSVELAGGGDAALVAAPSKFKSGAMDPSRSRGFGLSEHNHETRNPTMRVLMLLLGLGSARGFGGVAHRAPRLATSTRRAASPAMIAGDVALVTGGSRGIGRAIALALGSAGCKVVVNYMSSEGPAQEVVAAIEAGGGEAVALKADVSKQEEVVQLFKAASTAFGDSPISLLVNNGGITRDQLAIRLKPEQWREVIDCNLSGVWWCSQEAGKMMLRKRKGRIINIASVRLTAVVPPSRGRGAREPSKPEGLGSSSRLLDWRLAPRTGAATLPLPSGPALSRARARTSSRQPAPADGLAPPGAQPARSRPLAIATARVQHTPHRSSARSATLGRSTTLRLRAA
jgi:NAD(P)-dependent dehydrogenase (short-subunit alcohol dehydrogenase family)